jgi:hypothetical protein
MAQQILSENRRGFVDLTGRTFERWLVLGFDRSDAQGRWWKCRCACGVERPVKRSALFSGRSRSCGCLVSEVASALLIKRNTTHGLSKTPEYLIWKDIVKRCSNPKHREFHVYGGRGVGIFPEWRESFPAFLSHVGKRPSLDHSIDRIDNDGSYAPGNVRWAKRDVQRRNCQSSRIHMLTYEGKTMCLADWATERNIPYHTLKNRINRYGFTTEQALTWPLCAKRKKT